MDWLLALLLSKIYQSPILLVVYKAFKCVYRLTTGTCELYRVCHSASQNLLLDTKAHELTDIVPVHEDTVYRIDRSILYSKQLRLERRELESPACQVSDIVVTIIAKKRFPVNNSQHSPETIVLRSCLLRISETYQLVHEINERARTHYDTADPRHEQSLMRLWKLMMPDTKLESRQTNQWQEIGFQGQDPATDFRGMGMQGLDDLLYYAQTYPDSALRALSCSRHPISWYPYAIVGISITQYAIQTLRTRQLQHYLFKYGCSKACLSEFYCYLYHMFNEFWVSHQQPQLTIIDFEDKFKEFKRQIDQQLLQSKIQPLHEILPHITPLNEKHHESL